jgi:NAD(P)H-dependent FMN reductase
VGSLDRHSGHKLAKEAPMNDAKALGDTGSREPVRILVFSASLRKSSLNTRLASLAASVIDAEGAEVDLASMAEFDCPSYDGDAQDHDGFPTGAVELRRRVECCDGFVISSPEYNASLPGVLKNAVDWVSRFHPQPFNERYGLLLSASPSMVGGNRASASVASGASAPPRGCARPRVVSHRATLIPLYRLDSAEGERRLELRRPT